MEIVENFNPGARDLDLRGLILLLWRGKWIIVSVTTIITVAAIATAFVIPKRYTAAIVVSPVTNSSQSGALGGLGSLGSSLGGLASLAGVSLSGDQKKSESIAILQSDAMTEKYINEHDLLPVLFWQHWDPDRKRWDYSDPSKVPTPWKGNDYFKNHVRNVVSDAKTGLVTLTITWRDPVRAARWANDLVKMTNDFMRDQAIDEGERNIAYLNEQSAKTDILAAKQAMYTLLQTEINKVMLARGNEAYALKVIDPAEPPEEASFPKKINWAVSGFAGGLLLSLMTVFLRANWVLQDKPGRMR